MKLVSRNMVCVLLAMLLLPLPVLAQNEGPTVDGPPPSQAEKPASPDQIIPFQIPDIPAGSTLSLQDALAAADERNLSLEATRMELAKADGELYKSWASLFPSANATLTYSHMDHADTANFGGTSITTRHQDSLSGGVEVNMPIVNPQIWAGIGMGKAGKEIAALTVENAKQSLLIGVAQAYYQALTTRSLIQVQLGQLRSASEHLAIAQTRLVSGVGQRVDVIRARQDAVRLHESLLSAHAALTNARDALGRLTGLGGLPMPSTAKEMSAPAGSEEEMVEKGIGEREDIRLKKALTKLNKKQLTVSWMQFLPSLNASWQLSHQFTEVGDMGDSDPTRWTAYLVLSVPIYTQTRYADLDVSRATVRKSELEAKDAEQAAALEIRTARRDYATAVQKIATASEQASLAAETLVIVETSYRVGTGSSLAVTDARRTSAEAEINLATKRLEAQLALLKLLRSVGEDMTGLAH